MKRISLYLAVANPVSAAIVHLMLDVREHIPRWLVYVFYPIAWYFTLSVFISLVGIIIGLLALKKSDRKSLDIIGAAGNAVYFVWILYFVKSIWPALMSV